MSREIVACVASNRLVEPATQLLLAAERFAVDQFENQSLAAGLHRYQQSRDYTDHARICIDFVA